MKAIYDRHHDYGPCLELLEITLEKRVEEVFGTTKGLVVWLDLETHPNLSIARVEVRWKVGTASGRIDCGPTLSKDLLFDGAVERPSEEIIAQMLHSGLCTEHLANKIRLGDGSRARICPFCYREARDDIQEN